MAEFELNWLAVLAGAVVHFAVQGIWYSIPPISNRWMELLDKPEGYWEERQNPQIMGIAFGTAAFSSLLLAFVFYHITWAATVAWEVHGFGAGASAGFWLWLGSIATDTGTYGFEGKPWRLWPIEKLDRLFCFTLACGVMAYIAGF